jgi:DNA-binding response OmpR family regulator
MKKFTVFILDDDKVFCGLLLSLVEQGFFLFRFDNYKVKIIVHYDMENLDNAVKYAQNNRPDLVLLDYMLGLRTDDCLSSLEIFRKIIPYCPNIKLMTGLYPEDVRLSLAKEALDTIGIDILQKPFGIEELLIIIEGSIRKKEDG